MCGGFSSASPPSAISRGDFIKLGGIGIAGAALLGIMGSGGVMAQSDSTLRSEFEAAASEFDIPAEVLMAMGWVNTRWEMPPPDANVYEEGDLHGVGMYGIMALVKNPSSNTLGEAAELTGISEETLKGERVANIRGAAAVLAKSRRAVGGRATEDLGVALEAVEGATVIDDAVAGVGGGELYQEQVLAVLKSGVSGETGSGERLEIPAQEGVG